MDDKDQTTRPQRDDPKKPIERKHTTSRQPEHHGDDAPGAASGDPTE